MTSNPIELVLVNHTFRFRRLTWRDEVEFSQKHPAATRVDYAAYALDSVDSRVLTFEQARAALAALPKPIRDRVLVFYMGSLPTRRSFTAEVPYAAPEPVPYQQQVTSEFEEQEGEGEDALERTFGKEEVAEAQALARRMAENTGYAGVGPALTDEGIDEEPPTYHMVVT